MLSDEKEKEVLENQLSEMSRVIKQKIGIFQLNLLSPHLDKDRNISQQNFWKVKKKLFPKAHSVPQAVIDNLGNETTQPSNIKKLYQSEFEYCLRKRNMKVKLKEHVSD